MSNNLSELLVLPAGVDLLVERALVPAPPSYLVQWFFLFLLERSAIAPFQYRTCFDFESIAFTR